MMTAKATVVLVLAYVLALAAGTTSGVLAERLRAPNNDNAAAPLAVQLQLTDDQRDRMRQMWEQAQQTVDDCYKQAQSIERERDQALVDLLTDEQKAKFAPMDKAYAEQFAALAARRTEAFEDAFDKTEQLLSSDQKTKYEQIVRDRLHVSPLQSGAATEPSVEDLRP
jgi:Spy/CpxP family protein refolding chaperone